MNIALRKRTLSPVRLLLEDSPKRSFMLLMVASLQLGSLIQSNHSLRKRTLSPVRLVLEDSPKRSILLHVVSLQLRSIYNLT